MASLNKPKGITVTLRDRKDNKSRSFVIYDETLDELEKKIKKLLA